MQIARSQSGLLDAIHRIFIEFCRAEKLVSCSASIAGRIVVHHRGQDRRTQRIEATCSRGNAGGGTRGKYQ
ncbi:hypothetical protein ANTRET_LOCUS4944 [Anthophora retusa]